MLSCRSGHTSVTYGGEIYVIGGGIGVDFYTVYWAEKYNPERDDWTVAGYTRTARKGACAVLVGNKVYIFGGEEEGGGILAEVETYIVDSDNGLELYDNEIPDMPEALAYLSASLVAPNIIMVCGLN